MAEVNLQDAVKKFASDLAEKVNTFVTDISELEVRTYTTPADQVETFVLDLDKGQVDFTEILTEGKVTLRAYTKISFDGDTTVWVPTDASGEINKSVWELHQATVQQAMTNRTVMIQSIGEAASSALKALGLASGE
jgi:hypothetical protein